MTARAFLLASCIVAGAAAGCGSETSAEDGTGPDDDCPSALDCDCLGGITDENECGGFTCTCPALCTNDDECSGGFCLHLDGRCTESPGYCTTIERQTEDAERCTGAPASCGCDGQVYANACEATAHGVSPSNAPTSDCRVPRVPCSDAPGAEACFPETEFCETSGGRPPECRSLDGRGGDGCDDLTCECIAPIYSSETCSCAINEAGFVSVECTGT